MANVLNVYDTLFGNTKTIAYLIEEVLIRKKQNVITADTDKITMDLVKKSDFMIIGSPTHYWKPSKKITSFLLAIARERISGKYALAYDTKLDKLLSGNAARKMAVMLLGLKFRLVGKGDEFLVETSKGPLKLGELDKCERLARSIALFIDNTGLKNKTGKHCFVLEE